MLRVDDSDYMRTVIKLSFVRTPR